MHRRSVAAMLALLFLVPTLSGCFGAEENLEVSDSVLSDSDDEDSIEEEAEEL